MSNSLSFTLDPAAEGRSTVVTPRIDGTPLTVLATAYEESRGYDPAGGYQGLESTIRLISDGYYLGEWLPNPDEPVQLIDLLGCTCGEVACWPLSCRVEVRSDRVIWRDFGNEHRRERDYTGLGPFSFERADYDRALADLKIKLETEGQ